MVMAGVFNSLFVVSGMTLLQMLTPSEVRGRVVAARMTVINGALALGSATGGALLLLFADLVTRSLDRPVPIGVITALAGTPLFLWLLLHQRRGMTP